jgi:hypothetical protein
MDDNFKLKEFTMKKYFKLFGIIALVAIIGFSMAACDSSGGTFTITDIPLDLNGKYMYLFGPSSDFMLMGFQNIDPNTGTITACMISNQRVSLPMWMILIDSDNAVRYTGNDYITEPAFYIFDKQTLKEDDLKNYNSYYHFDSITFSNGSATKSWSEGY